MDHAKAMSGAVPVVVIVDAATGRDSGHWRDRLNPPVASRPSPLRLRAATGRPDSPSGPGRWRTAPRRVAA